MNRDEVLKAITGKFQSDIVEVFDKSPKRVYIDLKPEAIRAVAQLLFKELGARFNIASGTDERDRMEILYHFTLEDINLIISFRVKLQKPNLRIDSLVPVFEAANWIEREMHELLGLQFTGHPDLRRLLLPETWPEGVYPLRRDYKEWDPTAIRDRGV